MPGIITCPKCGNEVPSSSQFCIHCSARLCPGCHGLLPPGVKYCPKCGFSVGEALPGRTEKAPPTVPSAQAPGAAPRAPIPQPKADSGYITGRQSTEARDHGPPSAMEYGKMHQQPVAAQQPDAVPGVWGDTLPSRRFPKALVPIAVIFGIAILGFVAFQAGWLEGPFTEAQEFASGIEWPSFLSLAPADTMPPVISNVDVSSTTEASVVVRWETDEPATSQVMVCDPDGFCTWSEPDEALLTSHSANLLGLEPNTTYHFTVMSKDSTENEAVHEGELTTLAGGDITPPLISEVDVSDTNELGATVKWATDEPVTSQVEYGTTDACGSTTPLYEELTTNHTVVLTGLAPDTTYHFRVKSTDASGNEATSETDQTFTTLSALPVDLEVGPEVGMRAPGFSLPAIDGEELSLSDFRGKKIMLYFWQVGHSSCRTEIEHIQKVLDNWSGDELVVLAVHLGESAAVLQEVRDFIDSQGLTFPVLLDLEGKIGSEYNHNPPSTTFFIDAQGIIRAERPEGLRNAPEIEGLLKSL